MYFLFCAGLALFLARVCKVRADCLSYGWDFVDGGSYFINTLSPDFFSFGTDFFGCQPSDSQGDVIPILIDPDENEYFCSGIQTTPDGVDQISTCNVTGNEVFKSQMYSGDWICIIEGLTFAWMRTFHITAGPQQTVTITPIAFFNVTVTPSTTLNTTSTIEYDTTIPPMTITVPSTTVTKTCTTTPSKITVTSTSTIPRTRTTRIFSHTWMTTTETTSCKTQPPKKDPTCTIHPTKALLETSSISPTTSTALKASGHRNRKRDVVAVPRARRNVAVEKIVKRSPDVPTTTIVETTYIISEYTTYYAPTSTEIDTVYTTTTSAITPSPTTVYSGTAKTTVTVTAPTPTRTVVTRTYVTLWTTKTIWATITSTVKVPPSGVVCSPTP